MDEGLRPFVNDDKIYVFDIPRLSPETIDKFTTEFRIVAEYCVARTNGKDCICHAYPGQGSTS